jgi:hypothetical protein
MKPKHIVLVAATVFAAVVAHTALVMLLITGAPPDAAPARPGVVNGGAVAPAPLAGGLAELFALAPAGGQPVTPDELRGLRGKGVATSDYAFTGPFTHGNLAVFFVHGPDTLRDEKVLPLQTALERNLAVVREGGLTVDNRADVPLFIQAGDIVKGGIQDRVLPYDQLVPPGVNQLPVAAFCVEAGRSFPRGDELSTSFQTSMEQLPGRRLHLAARYRHSQIDVWNGVRETQAALARSLGGSVQSPQSQTSLQLTLESPLVHQNVQGYLNELAPAPNGKDDVIGVVVALNGQIQGAEVYGSAALFRDLWPKLLKANAVAALAEAGPAGAVPSVAAVKTFLADAEREPQCQQERVNRTLVLRQDTARAVVFDTCDTARQNAVLHRTVLAK